MEWFVILVSVGIGLAMIALWTMLIVRRQVPELEEVCDAQEFPCPFLVTLLAHAVPIRGGWVAVPALL